MSLLSAFDRHGRQLLTRWKVITIIFSLLVGSSAHASPGLKYMVVGVNGLTCSQCSRSVEMSIRRLGFVDSVSMNLENTEGRIYLKADLPPNLNEIADAVTRAGFSVRSLQLVFSTTDLPIKEDGTFSYKGMAFQWLHFNKQPSTSEISLKLVDAAFLPRKESMKWKDEIKSAKNDSDQPVLHVVQD